MDDRDFDAPATGDELVTVATFDNAVAARLTFNHVREAGLLAVLLDENTVATDWLLSNAIGGIKIQVNSKDVTRARQLIDDHQRQSEATDGEPAPLTDEMDGESLDALALVSGPDDVPSEEDGTDFEEEPPISSREQLAMYVRRGAFLGILFPPIEFYVLYLVTKVFVSDEPLGALPQYVVGRGTHHAHCPRRMLRDCPTGLVRKSRGSSSRKPRRAHASLLHAPTKAGHATSKKVRPLPGGCAEVRAAAGSGPSSPAAVLRQLVNVPDTSLSLVEAVLPVMVVLSITTVPPVRRSSPPPIPTPATPAAPGLPGNAAPALPLGLPPAPATTPPGSPPAPPSPRLAWLPVMESVALDCLDPLCVPSLGLMVRVPAAY